MSSKNLKTHKPGRARTGWMGHYNENYLKAQKYANNFGGGRVEVIN